MAKAIAKSENETALASEGGDKKLLKFPLFKGDLGGSGLGLKRHLSRILVLS
jgi:hypothetical protein